MNKADAQKYLSPAELLQIKDCLTEAEKNTSGEIRVVIVSASSIIGRMRHADRVKAVTRRAKLEFRRLKMNATRDSTGVLILISLKEHMVRIQPDKGIGDLLPESSWQPFVNSITEGMRGGFPAKGICSAICNIGIHLNRFFPIKDGDINELPNDVIIKGRW